MSEIKEFYAGSSVLITGGTGFLGAITLEKLVRSCPDLNNVYLLIRERNGSSIGQRLDKLLSLPVFQKLDDVSKSKIKPIYGDLSMDELGLNEADYETILENVSVVLHVAANINFSSRLSRSFEVNVLGTRRLLQIAKKMPKIKCFVYISTAYCNCIQSGSIEEKVYPSRWTTDELIRVQYFDLFDSDIFDKSILGQHPNPYTFSKQMAENLINDERGQLPVAIVRPSIVLGTSKEPIPGWVDNVYNGQFAFIAGAAVGIFRTLYADPDKVADMVPSDQLASLIITSAYSAHKERSMEVYHFTSGSKNPITWREYIDYTIQSIHKYPLLREILYPKVKCRASSIRNHLQICISHYIPAAVFDLISPLTKEEPIQLGIQKKYAKGTSHISHFTLKQFDFNTSNTDRLLESLTKDDSAEFDFNIGKIDWKTYMETCVLGVRKYYHNEDLNTLEKARQSFKADFVIYNIFWFVLFCVMWFATLPLGVCSLPLSLTLTLLYYLL